jgi:hypothetical protein
MMQPTRRGTWPHRVRAVPAILGLAVLAACGGGSSGGKTPPSSLSLHGEKIPVATLTTGLKGLCTVAHDALNPPIAKTAYFSGPYSDLHQLAGILQGSPSTKLLRAMEAFEREVLATPPPTSVAQTANALLGMVDTDLTLLKVPAIKC